MYVAAIDRGNEKGRRLLAVVENVFNNSRFNHSSWASSC